MRKILKFAKKSIVTIKTRGVRKTLDLLRFKFFPPKPRDMKVYLDQLRNKEGLEIGGPSRLFSRHGMLPIYSVIRSLDGCNFSQHTVWEGEVKEGRTYRYKKSREPGYQFICDAVDLKGIRDESYDFLLAPHVLEHIANPLLAITQWLRILKKGGILLLAVPHKDGTFDHKRPITSLHHLIEDLQHNTREDDLTHVDEILGFHDLSLDYAAGNMESFSKRSLDNYKNRCLHHHVFTSKLVIDIFEYFTLQIVCIDPILPYHILIMGKKLPDTEKPDNAVFLNNNAYYKKTSPFPSDRK